jgi:ABC-type multidrug transport system ATPase subunit
VEGIRANGLVKRFGGTLALDGVDLEVRPGEIVSLVGTNGAGKSTLVRILATTVTPDDGTATVGGYDVVAEAQRARGVTGLMLGDERAWYWRISGRRNLEFYAALARLRRAEAQRRCAELLEEVGLAEHADRRVGDYSSGMRARLGLARALLGRPLAVLLDEPTRSVDPIGAEGFRDRLTALAGDGGTAVLMTTHDLGEAASVAGTVVVLGAGRVRAVIPGGGDPAELHDAMRSLVPA